MATFTRLALAALALWCCGTASPCRAQVPGSARVLAIQPTTGVARVASGIQRVGGLRLTKFLEDGVEVPSAILVVTWSQMPGLAPAGLELRLDYLMDDRTDIQSLTRALPSGERGPSEARLEIPLTRETGRRVSAWRLQLRARERVLEEYRSAAWR